MATAVSKWVPIVTRRITVFRTFITARGSRDEVARYLGHGCDYLAITKNDQCSVYLAVADTKRVSEIVLEKIKTDPRFPAIHADDCRNGCGDLVSVSQACAATVADNSATMLKEKFTRYCDAYVRFAKFMAIPVAIERTLTARITAAIQAVVGAERTADYLKKLMTPPALSEFQKEPTDLLRLAIAPNATALASHVQRYCWLSCYNIDEPAYTPEYFTERLAQLAQIDPATRAAQLQALENQVVEDQKIFEATLSELALPDTTQKEIALLREYVHLRTYRVEMQSKANFYIQPLFQEIAHQLRLNLASLTALTPEEILNALEGGALPTDDLMARSKNYGFRYDANGILFVTDEQAAALETSELQPTTTTGNALLRGTPAYQGTAQGIVRVVLTKDEIRNFQPGEILVTTMTTPEFVPAMKKAAAIITNEGGVLCHAAIVARELKVPCIIGTERATALFKTGDHITIDATVGTASKI